MGVVMDVVILFWIQIPHKITLLEKVKPEKSIIMVGIITYRVLTAEHSLMY